MARKARPYYRSDRNLWEFTHNGQRYSRPHEGRQPKKGRSDWNPPQEIMDWFQSVIKLQRIDDEEPVVAVLDDFLTWTQRTGLTKPTSAIGISASPSRRSLARCRSAISTHTGHVTLWLNDQTTWNSTTKTY